MEKTGKKDFDLGEHKKDIHYVETKKEDYVVKKYSDGCKLKYHKNLSGKAISHDRHEWIIYQH